jgi:hypothetical protein
MNRNVSIHDVLARLEARVAHLSQQVELHSRQEAIHREQKEQSAAELEKVSQHLAEFRRTAGSVLEMAGLESPPATASDDGPDLGGKPMLSRLISAVIADQRGDEPFNATRLAREIDRRFGKKLGRRVNPRSVASQLRRLSQRGKIHQIQKGQAHREAVFTRERPKA